MDSRFQTDGISLYQGDALRLLTTLPAASVDAVLTDPPYSSGGVTLSARQTDPAHKYQASGTKRHYPPMLGDVKDQRSWIMWCTLWLGECWRIARDGAPLLVFTDWRQLPALSDAVQAAGWKWLGIIPWDKKSAHPQIGKFRQQCEYVLFAVKGRFIAHTRACLPGVYAYPVIPAQKLHLTSKPVALIEDLLAVTTPGGAVLDPSWAAAAWARRASRRAAAMLGLSYRKSITTSAVTGWRLSCRKRPKTKLRKAWRYHARYAPRFFSPERASKQSLCHLRKNVELRSQVA